MKYNTDIFIYTYTYIYMYIYNDDGFMRGIGSDSHGALCTIRNLSSKQPSGGMEDKWLSAVHCVLACTDSHDRSISTPARRLHNFRHELIKEGLRSLADIVQPGPVKGIFDNIHQWAFEHDERKHASISQREQDRER